MSYQPNQFTSGHVKPHRGVMILIFGIIGLVACVIFAPIAWVMGNADMKEIRAGTMDPEGESLTNIGRILGIIGSVLFLLGMCLWIPFFLLAIAAGGQ